MSEGLFLRIDDASFFSDVKHLILETLNSDLEVQESDFDTDLRRIMWKIELVVSE